MAVNFTDEEITLLVVKAQSRDQKAFESLYEHYQPRVSSRVFAIIGQSESVQDIAQEIWLAVFLALPTLKQPAAFPAWLMRITNHKAWKSAQQHASQTVSLDDQDEEILELVEDEDVIAIVLRDEQQRQMSCLFMQLTDKEREVLIPFYMEDTSLAEIATRLTLSLSAVKSRLHQARKRLRLILTEGGFFL